MQLDVYHPGSEPCIHCELCHPGWSSLWVVQGVMVGRVNHCELGAGIPMPQGGLLDRVSRTAEALTMKCLMLKPLNVRNLKSLIMLFA
jgi:hypothetical protein